MEVDFKKKLFDDLPDSIKQGHEEALAELLSMEKMEFKVGRESRMFITLDEKVLSPEVDYVIDSRLFPS